MDPRNASSRFLGSHMSERVAFEVFTREIVTAGQLCAVGNPLTVGPALAAPSMIAGSL
jgi:hypothetical protein